MVLIWSIGTCLRKLIIKSGIQFERTIGSRVIESNLIKMLNGTVDSLCNDSLKTMSDSLRILSGNTRHIFFGVFTVLAVTSLIGNLAVIYSISKIKYRFIQKAFIISLALSDLLSTVSVTVNNLETFSHPLINWTLGKFLCSAIPFCQFWGMMSSSDALGFLALDRYRNIIHALGKRWNPSRTTSILLVLTLWILSFLLSIPMYLFFSINQIVIIYEFHENYVLYDNAEICVTLYKNQMTIYHIFMLFIIFVPLLSIFIWFYYNIALLVWKHRKPVTSNTENSGENEDTSCQNQSNRLKTIMSNNKSPLHRDVKVERKIRTFKIIIVLMLVFLICRLPQYIFMFLKLTTNLNAGKDNGETVWIINYVTISLTLLNCTLNPLLYTFLHQTIMVCSRVKKAINAFTCEICCCCFSNAEFEDFEKRNPFVVETLDRRQQASMGMNKKNRNSSVVKFEDLYNNNSNNALVAAQKY